MVENVVKIKKQIEVVVNYNQRFNVTQMKIVIFNTLIIDMFGQLK